MTIDDVIDETERATALYPTWPTDVLHALAVVGEEFGEVQKAALQMVYEPHKSTIGDLRCEAVQCAAMLLRFIESMDRYTFERLAQHEQGEKSV